MSADGHDDARSPVRSLTPSSLRRGRSRTRRSSRAVVVQERVVREHGGGSFVYPELTWTNYIEWALGMKVNLKAQGLWDAIELGCDVEREDSAAMAAILRAVPADMHGILAVKPSVKEAWEAVKVLSMGVERARPATAQRLRNEFEPISFMDGESVDVFGMRSTSLVNNMRTVRDKIEDAKVVTKFLRVVPRRYSQVAIAIETLLNVSTLTIEELTGWLRSVEERYGLDDSGGSSSGTLLMTEAEWDARRKNRERGNGDNGSGAGRNINNGGGTGAGGNINNGGGTGAFGSNSGGRGGRGRARGGGSRNGPRPTDQCRYCKKLGHWARDCNTRKREQAHHVQAAGDDDADPALLLTSVCALTEATEELAAPAPPSEIVMLNEERAGVLPGRDGERHSSAWFLDTSASNHMTGDRSLFAELDTGVGGNMRFGDGSVVDICGRDTLDEVGCRVTIKHGELCVLDTQRQLLSKVQRNGNCLYVLRVKPAQPQCMVVRYDSVSWRWHARMGHLNFQALQKLAREEMVRGLPRIDHVDELCDAFLAGKQRRAPFPVISPPTPGGKRYFLLLVEDRSRYMWLVLLASKDQAQAAIRRFKATVEVEAGRPLRALRTDRGGEFTSAVFMEYCAEEGVKRKLTTLYTPQQNGVVERNQIVVPMARSMLKAKGLPAKF
ncbi:uncharacterized protein [Aegilops tauschii subsp. strangulata]|uniref:uncharacterized protein n=1 Tax=Aegilops tauschii subsp. strangulata TaxID=200361 RepID=UPI003CC8D02C